MRIDSGAAGSGRSGRRAGLAAALILATVFLLTACSGAREAKEGKGGKGDKPRAAAPVPVAVAITARKDVPVTVEAIGVAEPFAAVAVKSQVAGILEKVNFREGDPVKAGDLLFAIDPRPFIARFEQAQGALARDQAGLDNARKQAERYGPAAEKGYVSEEQAEQVRTSVATLAALVQADQAAVASARLDLDNCTIRAPISGQTGELLATPGNLVQAAADRPLVTINQLSPIKVVFTLPEQHLPEVRRYLTGDGLEVQVTPPGDGARPLLGRMAFLDNTVDQASGTIRLKATFANSERSLWPGQFVKVSLRLTTRRQATVVPAPAVQTGQSGTYVYVVKPDQSVEERPVGVAFSGGGEAVIASGLTVGETVVTDGQLRLKPGAQVKTLRQGGSSDRSDKSDHPVATR